MQKDKFRNYTLSQMEDGDRFYFVGDKKKTVYHLNWLLPFETVKQKGYWFRYANCLLDDSLISERHRADRNVIFLRNIFYSQ